MNSTRSLDTAMVGYAPTRTSGFRPRIKYGVTFFRRNDEDLAAIGFRRNDDGAGLLSGGAAVDDQFGAGHEG